MATEMEGDGYMPRAERLAALREVQEKLKTPEGFDPNHVVAQTIRARRKRLESRRENIDQSRFTLLLAKIKYTCSKWF